MLSNSFTSKQLLRCGRVPQNMPAINRPQPNGQVNFGMKTSNTAITTKFKPGATLKKYYLMSTSLRDAGRSGRKTTS
jgi:hypothetical protein